MSDVELSDLNALVAEKVMGWKKRTEIRFTNEPGWCDPDGIIDYVPEFTSIVGAFQVIAKVFADDGWSLMRNLSGRYMFIPYSLSDAGEGETAAIAICQSALKRIKRVFEKGQE